MAECQEANSKVVLVVTSDKSNVMECNLANSIVRTKRPEDIENDGKNFDSNFLVYPIGKSFRLGW